MGVVRHFKRFWRFHSFIALSLSVSAFTLGCAVKEPAFFEGTWVVTEAHQPGISAVSPQQAQTILGRSLQYKSDRATLNQQQCITPRYHKQQFHLDDFSQYYRVDAKSLGFVPGKVTQVTIDCGLGAKDIGSTLVFQEDTTAYTVFNGTFYRIEKTLEVAPI